MKDLGRLDKDSTGLLILTNDGDLINEWRVSDDTNGAIKLSKVRESGATQDVLYAESIISDHDDNILVNDNGALYVSSAPIDSLREEIEQMLSHQSAQIAQRVKI